MATVLEITLVVVGLGVLGVKAACAFTVSQVSSGATWVKNTRPVSYMSGVSQDALDACEKAGREYLANKKNNKMAVPAGSMADVWNKAK